jgi:hypothetical protein
MKRIATALLVMIACFAATRAEAGRSRPEIECLKPSWYAPELTYAPADFELSFSASADAQTFAVTLNGHDVTGAFAVAAPVNGRRKATAEDVWGGMLLPGANHLHAQVVKAGVTHQCDQAFQANGDAYADAVEAYAVGTNGGFPGTQFLPDVVTGPPSGAGLFQGSLDAFSLGFGGTLTVRFDDNVIANGPGDDFSVFENAFLAFNAATLTIERPFADPAIVSVSQDGSTWHTFACQLVTNPALGIFYPGCAGVYPVLATGGAPHVAFQTPGGIGDLVGEPVIPPPVPGGAGGDSFDLSEVGLAWARWVRIEDANVLTGDPFGPNNAGADVDAIGAIHAVPPTDWNGNGVPDAVE